MGDCSGKVNGILVKLDIVENNNSQTIWFKHMLFCLVVDEKRKSKTTHMVLLEIIKEEGL